jgi:hypothetical protein
LTINPINGTNSYLTMNMSMRETVEAKPAGDTPPVQKASLYNPKTGEAMTPEEAAGLFQQITSQPHWNRHDVNFYVSPPVAMKLPMKESAAAGGVNLPTATGGSGDNGDLQNKVGAESDTQTERAALYNPQTGEAMTPQEAAELFQQITSQPHWNRHDVNFYVPPPAAMKLPEKVSAASDEAILPGTTPDIEARERETGTAITGEDNPAASLAAAPAAEIADEENAARLGKSQPASTSVISTPAETVANRNNHPVQSQAPEPVKYENEINTRELTQPLWNNRNFDYYQLWLETLASTYIEYDKPAWEELLNSPGRRFWDVKV